MISDALRLAMQVEAAQEIAQTGAVDHPQSLLFDLYGTTVFPGQKVVDSVTGEVMEVVSAGVQTTVTGE